MPLPFSTRDLARSLAAAAGLAGSLAHAQVTIPTVIVGNPGNTGRPSGAGSAICVAGGGQGPVRVCGSVGYVYEIGTHEVTSAQYVAFLNAVARTDTFALYNTAMNGAVQPCGIVRSGSAGSFSYSVAPEWANRPVAFVSFGDAVRFANWMHNSQPSGAQDPTTTEDGSYLINGATTNPTLQPVTRRPGATWVVPSEDEWVKAAYHSNNGATGSYASFPMNVNHGSFCAPPPNAVITPDPGGSANFGSAIGVPYWRVPVGEYENSASAYGTFDQGGNVWEWTDSWTVDGVPATRRILRGGSFNEGADAMHRAWRDEQLAVVQLSRHGFRLARITTDCNGNESPDTLDIDNGSSRDDNSNDIPDECDIAAGRSEDCNGNGVPDEAETGAAPPRPYQWDDGSSENVPGFGLFADGSIAWLNGFTSRIGRETIDAVDVSFGITTLGAPFSVHVWSDPDQDGNPLDAVLLASASASVAIQGSNAFQRVDLPDTPVGPAGTKFFVGVFMVVTDEDIPVHSDASSAGTGDSAHGWIVLSTDVMNPVNPGSLGSAGTLLPYPNVAADDEVLMVRGVPVSPAAFNDLNHDGIPDDCQSLCDADVNADGNVDQGDVDYLIDVVGGGMNPSGIDPDFNRDGNVDQDDVDALLNVIAGGPCP